MSQEIVKKSVPIEFYETEDTVGAYADRIVIAQSEEMLTVRFFQTLAPMAVGDIQVGAIEKVRALCIAKIIVTPAKIKEFADVMRVALDRYVGGEQEQGTRE